jgi:hydrogenase maturation protein HypF
MVVSLVDDMKHAETRAFISRKFHNTIVSVIREVVKRLSSETGITTVALSGGVFQNSFILEEAAASLRSLGNTVYQHAVLPPNDGCISLGQAAVAQELRTKNRI